MGAPYAAGQILTAATLNEPFPLGDDAWATYIPTLTQPGAVTNNPVGRYQRVGRLIVVNTWIGATGAGTAANAVTVGLPVAASSALVLTNQAIGSGVLFDASAGIFYAGILVLASATTARLYMGATGTLGTGGFTAALANSDQVTYMAMYEANTS